MVGTELGRKPLKPCFGFLGHGVCLAWFLVAFGVVGSDVSPTILCSHQRALDL